MKSKKKWLAGSLGMFVVLALILGFTTLRPGKADAGCAGDCVLAATQFGYGEGSTCPAARRACKADLDSRLGSACIGPRYTGENCGVGSITYGTCTTLPNGTKARDCHRDVYCEEVCPWPPWP